VQLVGEQTVQDYERYLSAAVDAFRKRHIGLIRVLFERT
jgi:cyclopropane-fatty-acyl-phospholipid synthase